MCQYNKPGKLLTTQNYISPHKSPNTCALAPPPNNFLLPYKFSKLDPFYSRKQWWCIIVLFYKRSNKTVKNCSWSVCSLWKNKSFVLKPFLFITDDLTINVFQMSKLRSIWSKLILIIASMYFLIFVISNQAALRYHLQERASCVPIGPVLSNRCPIG